MPPGTPVFLRTEFANGELADLEMRFVQVVDDFLAADAGLYGRSLGSRSDPARRHCSGDERFAHFYRAGHMGSHFLCL